MLKKLKGIDFRQFFVGPMRSAIWGCFFLILLSVLVFLVATYAIRKDSEIRLLREFARIEDQITNRLQVYANSMLSIRSYLYNFQNSTPAQLNRYLEDMQLFERYPGMKAIGYAEVLSKSEFAENALRLSQLVSNFSLDQYSNTSDYYAFTTSIYPRDLVNQKVLGFNMLSEPIRKAAILRSIQTDKPILTNPIILTQDADDPTKPSGVLLFFPVYRQSDPRLSRIIQNTSGVVFVSMRTIDFFSATFGERSSIKEKVGFSIETVSKDQKSQKLYDRFDEKFTSKLVLAKNFELFGQSLRLTVYPLKGFYTTYDILFPYALSLLTLLICSLIFMNIRNNAIYATNLGKTNNLLNSSLSKQTEKQEDLIILNRTLQKMSHSLETDKIAESFMQGVSEIFENKGKFAIYSVTKSKPEIGTIICHLISSNDDAFFEPDCKINQQTYQKIFTQNTETKIYPTQDLNFLVINPRQNYYGMCSKMDASSFGSSAFTVFISTSNEIDETESVLFEALMKHFNTSIQNSLLLKKVEDANQSKSAFLANMSHEIRTPLNALMGFSEMLIREDVDQKSKSELSNNIARNGEQLTRLVDDILDLSKIEAGKFLIDKKRTDLLILIQDVETVMRMRFNSTNLEFLVHIDGKIPQFAQTDPIRLKQILTNLIGNSIKFTNKGLVRLRVSYEKEEGNKKAQLFFRVEDTGKGIDKDFRPKLFLPFSQADSTPTRSYGGTGLGLAICKRLATEMGGSLSLIFSEKDIGSVFELTIPVETLEDQQWTDTLPQKPDHEFTPHQIDTNFLKQKKILLVEDSPDNQDFFKFFLNQAGGDVKIISNGLDAVEEASKKKYDIILMDIQIPGIDGKEATKRIRARGFKGPIVALTAHAMAEEQKNCIKAGCNGQISKPVSGEMLIAQVSNFIEGNHATST